MYVTRSQSFAASISRRERKTHLRGKLIWRTSELSARDFLQLFFGWGALLFTERLDFSFANLFARFDKSRDFSIEYIKRLSFPKQNSLACAIKPLSRSKTK